MRIHSIADALNEYSHTCVCTYSIHVPKIHMYINYTFDKSGFIRVIIIYADIPYSRQTYVREQVRDHSLGLTCCQQCQCTGARRAARNLHTSPRLS